MKEEHRTWRTKYLNRNFDMLVFGESGFPIIIFATSKGSYYQNKDFGLVDCVSRFVDEGLVKIYTPDSIDKESWYNYDIHPSERVKNHITYENLILDEVIEVAKQETGFQKVAVAGASFGGYHAVNIAFRHPDSIAYMFSMSGAFDIKQFIFGYYDDNCYYNNPPDYLPGLNDSWYLENIKKMGIVLGTGGLDSCRNDNINLSNILKSKGIEHWLDDEQSVGHDWPWWKEMLPKYISSIKEIQHKL